MYENRKVLYSFYIDRETLEEVARRASAANVPVSVFVRSLVLRGLGQDNEEK